MSAPPHSESPSTLRAILLVSVAAVAGAALILETDLRRGRTLAASPGSLYHLGEDRVVCGGTLRPARLELARAPYAPRADVGGVEAKFTAWWSLGAWSHADRAGGQLGRAWRCREQVRRGEYHARRFECDRPDWWPVVFHRAGYSWVELRRYTLRLDEAQCAAMNAEVRF